MTNEEAIKQIDDLKQYLNQSTAWYLNDKHKTALDMAISALSVPEKIRAEIENIPNDDTTKPIGTYDYCMGAENERKLILSIIDKYIDKAESGGKI